jgi:2-methylisocitrate lyase-like PEP mutase family enzyme
MIEAAGFEAYGVGGAALAATQLALPDAGLQSFGEYRDAVGRIMEGSRLPVMIDGENGFGDAKAVTRTVRSFERMGIGAIAFEDLVFPPVLGAAPTVISSADMRVKLLAALDARQGDNMLIIARTDAAYAVGLEEALARAKAFQQWGVDAVLTTGLPSLEAYQRLRDTVTLPIVAVVVPGTPWFAPSIEQMTQVGLQAALFPAAILTRVMQGIDSGLEAIRTAGGSPPSGFDMRSLGNPLRLPEWIAIDKKFQAPSDKP